MIALIPSNAKDLLARAATTFKRIAGMPNYEAYLEHLRTHHPECALPTEREYFDEYLRGKYGGGFSRCC